MRTATPGNLSNLLPEAVHYQGRTPDLVGGFRFRHLEAERSPDLRIELRKVSPAPAIRPSRRTQKPWFPRAGAFARQKFDLGDGMVDVARVLGLGKASARLVQRELLALSGHRARRRECPLPTQKRTPPLHNPRIGSYYLRASAAGLANDRISCAWWSLLTSP